MQLLMQMLQQMALSSPQQPANNVPSNLPAMGVPREGTMPTEQEMQINQLLSVLQNGSPHLMQGLQGAMGGPMGALGGRPPGS